MQKKILSKSFLAAQLKMYDTIYNNCIKKFYSKRSALTKQTMKYKITVYQNKRYQSNNKN